MAKSFTSREQSEELIKAGLDPSTAEMFWNGFIGEKGEIIWNSYPEPLSGDHYVPAWSLSSLIEMMPQIAYNYPILARWRGLNPEEPGYFIEYVDLNVSGENRSKKTEFYHTPIDAAVEMMLWLLEEERI